MPCDNGSVRVINGDTFRTLKYIDPEDVPNEIERLQYQEGFEADTDTEGDIVFHEEMEDD